MENLNEKNQEAMPSATETSASFDPSPDTKFLREKIKQKPINKKKLLRHTLSTILTAAIFGLVACVTFLMLEPFISSRINKDSSKETEQSVSTVDLPDTEDEISPEDMYATDSEMIEEALQGNTSGLNEDIQHIESMISDMRFGLEDYRLVYNEMTALADTVSQSVVTITGYTSGSDLLSNDYENNTQVSGLIVADNGPSHLILAKNLGIKDCDELQATFANGASTSCSILSYDEVTGFLILSVNSSAAERAGAVPATLGTSRSSSIKGAPVIALGSPTGIINSLSYGIITSVAKPIGLTDSDCTLITTDIVRAGAASGIIFNLRGYVVGVIDNSYNAESGSQLLTAVGITELKPLIEKLSNKTEKAHLGIHGTDITQEMMNVYGLPEGIYLSSIDMDSPAMAAGLQNGDILVTVNGEEPDNYHDFIKWLYEASPGDDVTLGIRRQSVNDYVPLSVTVTLGSTNYNMEEREG